MTPDILIKPHEDETLTNYIFRLIETSGLSPKIIFDKKRNITSTNFNLEFKNHYEFFDIIQKHYNTGCFDYCAMDIFALSMYKPINALISPFRKAAWVDSMLSPFPRPSLFPAPTSVFPSYKVYGCPKCAKEDITSGKRPYIRRLHQIPSVTACSKHGCLTVPWEKTLNTDIISASPSEVAYALFSKQFLSQDISIEMLFDCVRLKASEDKKVIFNDKSTKALYKNILCKTSFSSKPALLLRMLFELFGSAEELERYLERVDKNTFSLGNFTLLSEPKNGIAHILCPTCGNSFITTDYYLTGFGCPFCNRNLSDTEILKQAFPRLTNNSYQLTGEFNGMYKKTMFTHNSCGNSFETLPQKILYKDYHCSCELKISKNVAEKRVSERARFKLQKYSGPSDPVIVKCNECSAEIKFKTLYSCVEATTCPNCSRDNYYSDARIQTLVTDLSGKHLSLLNITTGSNKKSRMLTFHCNDCGETIYVPFDKFVAGQICKCGGKMPYKQFQEYVYTCTGKRYIVGKEVKRKYYEITNRKSGEIKVLPKKVILREINRSSDSVILKYSKATLFRNHRKILSSMTDVVEEMKRKKKDHFFIRFLKKRTGCTNSDILLGIWIGLFRFNRKRQNVLSLCNTKAE